MPSSDPRTTNAAHCALIRCSLTDGTVVTLAAPFVYGPLAVVRYRGLWRVVHVPTGTAISRPAGKGYRRREAAEERVAALMARGRAEWEPTIMAHREGR